MKIFKKLFVDLVLPSHFLMLLSWGRSNKPMKQDLSTY